MYKRYLIINVTKESMSSDDQKLAENLKRRDQNDPKEVAIRERVRALILHGWVEEAVQKVTNIQREQLRHLIAELQESHAAGEDRREYIHQVSQDTYRRVAEQYRAHVDDTDRDLLAGIREDEPVLITTNHLGVYKLSSVQTADVGAHRDDYPQMYPYWAYAAGLHPIADHLRRPLTYVSNRFPHIFDDVHRHAGFLHLPGGKDGGGVEMLQQQVRAHLERHPTGVIVYFPEGTTSGKPNESDPYHLARFKRGAYAVAHNLQITRVLVAQFFDPRIGLRAKVLDVGQVPYSSEDSHCVCGDFAARDQVRMQAYLDAMLEQVHPEVLGMRPIS